MAVIMFFVAMNMVYLLPEKVFGLSLDTKLLRLRTSPYATCTDDASLHLNRPKGPDVVFD